MREALFLDALQAAIRQGGALVYRDGRFVLAMQGRELARGEGLQDLALTLATQAGEAPRRGPWFPVWLGRDLLHAWGRVRRSRESLSAFIRKSMRSEIAARREHRRQTPCAQ